eukprot:TRINITY_DN3718_c0_g2_i1.p1 TRINITY_DN3718_c0_g2~~TRINITY_DN3718_c0_g2_i1.p1  ORF type:complete len:263 (-),score=58.02 TRINITY_DN3718_c0_g2_i1:66-854(-)
MDKRRSYQLTALPITITTVVVLYYVLAMTFYIPTLAPGQSPLWQWLHYAATHLFAALTLYSYLTAVWSDPGSVPKGWHQPPNPSAAEYPLCTRCQEYKPSRTHHCAHCRRCVLRYDHHCDWIDNCVGQYNHKFFFLFLFYITLSILHYFYLAFSLLLWSDAYTDPNASGFFVFGVIVAVMYSLVVLPLSCFGIGFLAWTTYLIVVNETTMENGTNQDEKFDIGCIGNVKQVLGSNVLLWFVPVRITAPPIPTSTPAADGHLV